MKKIILPLLLISGLGTIASVQPRFHNPQHVKALVARYEKLVQSCIAAGQPSYMVVRLESTLGRVKSLVNQIDTMPQLIPLHLENQMINELETLFAQLAAQGLQF